MRASAILLCSLTIFSCSDTSHKSANPATESNRQSSCSREDYICQETETVMVGSVCEAKVRLTPGKYVGDNIATIEYSFTFSDPNDKIPTRTTDITFIGGTNIYLAVYFGIKPDLVAVNDNFFSRLSGETPELFVFVDTRLRATLERYRVNEDGARRSCDWSKTAKHIASLKERAAQALSTLEKLLLTEPKPKTKNAH